ncbi:LOW QUALITY PROTEIN: zinc finger X-linked protein ZXDB-like [Cydia pomonella]|uniref:LOW QUALITY PROTEIN: zinc finger X-linked protein ZXDB-like n=1 Tax=Cydia pomonella TaxID=82600 RepID=UPI002ADD9FB4|nr:LOW QUALITY PROTEIN: zinc finger X-linked protein ZXDB-like [Cydia pomonella]
MIARSLILTLLHASLLVSSVLSEDVRAKRQAGYVYNRPSISFDLPPRTTGAPTQGTQAPNVDRTRGGAQQMFYAYPAPASGSVDIGYSTTGSTAGTTTTTAGGYSYGGAQVGGGGGYGGGGGGGGGGYGGAGGGAGGGGSGSGGGGGGAGAGAGYSYDAPTTAAPRPSPTPGSPGTVSTNAPEYLPPVGGESVSIGGSTGVTLAPLLDLARLQAQAQLLGRAQRQRLLRPPRICRRTPPLQPQPHLHHRLRQGWIPAPGISCRFLPLSFRPQPVRPLQPGPRLRYLPQQLDTPPVSSPAPTPGTVSTPAATYLPPIFKK